MEQKNRKSVYRYGAEYGRFLGIYLIVMSALTIAGAHAPFMTLLMAALLPGFPVILYLVMRRIYREVPYYRTISAMWSIGNITVICGTLICALVSGLWLTFVEPNFFANYIRNCIATLQSSGQGAQYQEQIDMFKQMLQNGGLPSPMQFVVSMSWTTAFFGCILSMICGWLLVARERRKAFSTT